ncbi:hypothetical protein CWS35_22915 [Bradyrhizobium sp. SK17]|nr:hypothetical protein CWS35_22915 [Bradyrhizobium sp. SK17]
MPGLGPGIHVLFPAKKGVDGRDKPGHDGAHMGCSHHMRLRPAQSTPAIAPTRMTRPRTKR